MNEHFDTFVSSNRFYAEAAAHTRIPWAADLPTGYPQLSAEEAQSQRDTGQAVLQQIRDASAAGQKQVVIAPGDYLFNADCSRQSTLEGLADLEIVSEGVTFWFEPPLIHALLFKNCRNVTLRGLTIDFTVPCWFQAQVTTIDRQAKSLTARVMPGYEPIHKGGLPEASGERHFTFYSSDGRFINHRHTPTEWQLAEDGLTMHCQPGRFGIPEALHPGDYVVGNLRVGMALRTENCETMRYKAMNIWSSPGSAVWDGFSERGLPEHLFAYITPSDSDTKQTVGTGGHVYHEVRATRRPGTNRLHAFGSDIFHLAGADRGATLEGCELAYGSDDTFNIHGNFGRVVEMVDATHVYLQAAYEVDDSYLQGAYAAGDVLEFRDPGSLELLGMANVLEAQKSPDGPSVPINEDYNAKGEYLLELDRPLELPPLSMVVMDGRQSNTSFIIRNCWLHDNFQRALVNGSPGGLIENNLFENLGYGLCVQFETWGPWMEGPFARDLVVRGNHFRCCAPDEPVIAVGMFPGGDRDRWNALPVTNLTIEDNTIDATSGFPMKIHNVDGLHIRGNRIELAPLREQISRVDWRELKEPASVWSKGSADTPGHWLDLQDCANVTVCGNLLTRKAES